VALLPSQPPSIGDTEASRKFVFTLVRTFLVIIIIIIIFFWLALIVSQSRPRKMSGLTCHALAPQTRVVALNVARLDKEGGEEKFIGLGRLEYPPASLVFPAIGETLTRKPCRCVAVMRAKEGRHNQLEAAPFSFLFCFVFFWRQPCP
jgi:hypothetical protein